MSVETCMYCFGKYRVAGGSIYGAPRWCGKCVPAVTPTPTVTVAPTPREPPSQPPLDPRMHPFRSTRRRCPKAFTEDGELLLYVSAIAAAIGKHRSTVDNAMTRGKLKAHDTSDKAFRAGQGATRVRESAARVWARAYGHKWDEAALAQWKKDIWVEGEAP